MLRYDRQTKPGLVALYDIRPGNGAGPFLQPRSPHGALSSNKIQNGEIRIPANPGPPGKWRVFRSLLYQPVFPQIPRQWKPLGSLQNFCYRLDTLPVTQLTVSKHCNANRRAATASTTTITDPFARSDDSQLMWSKNDLERS